jgi:hypothetical protein
VNGTSLKDKRDSDAWDIENLSAYGGCKLLIKVAWPVAAPTIISPIRVELPVQADQSSLRRPMDSGFTFLMMPIVTAILVINCAMAVTVDSLNHDGWSSVASP